MEIAKDTPTVAITVQGIKLNAPCPFTEGHALKANEAAVLNQVLHENLRNNMAGKVKAAITEAGDAEKVNVKTLQKTFDEYVGTYDFGVRRAGGGGRSADPVEAEMKKLARAHVIAKLKEQGHKQKDVGSEKIGELITKLLESEKGQKHFRTKAEGIIKIRNAVASEELDVSV